MDAYSLFYAQNKDRLFGYLLRLTGEVQLSMDLVQESFARYLRRYGRDDLKKPLLYTIARNAALDAMRKQKMAGLDDGKVVDMRHNPEQQAIQREAVERMLAAISRLASVDREIVSLVATADLTYREIGRILNISEANVKIRIHRARIRLRKLLA